MRITPLLSPCVFVRCSSSSPCARSLAPQELSDFRAFELLRSHKTRANYLLLKQARIVAMTCTHAAIARRQLIDLGFR